jgi:uncharacterized membrane protein YqaE (UPF0057 family)
MKKLLAVLCGSIFIMSCSTEMSLAKRHYRSGYYFASGSKTKELQEHKATEAMVMPVTAKAKPVKAAEVLAAAPVTEREHAVSAPVQQSKRVAASKKPVNEMKQALTSPMGFQAGAPKVKSFMQMMSFRKEMKKKASGDTDATKIIMIILCLFPFINLIPVFLHDKSAITMNFWITLLLDCLFFLPGIIFSLLVVLDIVNLG